MKGFVYLLLNPTFPNMVKIGKTTKDPEVRVKELSRATGIPTPFKLIYQIFVSNCDVVEKEIHFELQNNGLRNTSNREFFNIEPFKAIELFKEYEERFRVTKNHSKMEEYFLKCNYKTKIYEKIVHFINK